MLILNDKKLEYKTRETVYSRCQKMQSTTGGSSGLIVKGGGSCPEGRGFESQNRILDGHISHIVMFAWNDENKLKRGRGWPIF